MPEPSHVDPDSLWAAGQQQFVARNVHAGDETHDRLPRTAPEIDGAVGPGVENAPTGAASLHAQPGSGVQVRLSPDAVLRSVNRLGTVADELAESMKRLIANVEGVVGVSWTGDAAKAYEANWHEFRDAGQRIIADAKEIEAYVRGCAAEFINHDSASAARFDRSGAR